MYLIMTCSLQQPLLQAMNNLFFTPGHPTTDKWFILHYFKEVEALLIFTGHSFMLRTLLTNPVSLLMTVWAGYTQLILQSTQVWQLL